MSRPLRAPVHRAVPTALLCAVAALCGCVTADADVPAGEPRVSREPLPTVPVDVRVLGATGDVVWALFDSADPAASGHRVSRDGGRTWAQGPVYPEVGTSAAGNGRLSFYGGDDGEAWPMAVDPSEPARTSVMAWDEEWRLAALGPAAALSTGRRLVTAGRSRKLVFPALPKGRGSWRHTYGFSADSAFLVRVSRPARGGRDYATIIDTATGKARTPVAIPRSKAHVVGGSTLYTLVSDASGLRVCRLPLPGGAQACDQVATGDHRGTTARLYQAGAASLVADGESALLLENGTVTPVALPTGTASWRIDAPGDPTRPLIRTVDAAGEPHHLRVAADGATTEWLTLSRRFVPPFSLALTPTTLLGSDGRSGDRVWLRDVSAGTLGARSDLAVAAPVAASGSRWLVLGNDGRFRAYDDGRPGAVVPQALAREASGPYLIGMAKVGLVTGKVLAASRPKALFGSLVVEDVSTTHTAGYTMRVRDLAGGYRSPAFLLTDRSSLYTWVRIWGDWVGTSVFSDAPDHDVDTVLHNYRTGASLTHPGVLWGLADGWALIQTPSEDFSFPLAAWNLTTGAVEPLDNQGFSTFAVNGDRVAYHTGTDLVLRTLEGVAAGPPRLLGALAAGKATRRSPWTVQLDLTEPVLPGTLVITDPDGAVVRTLASAGTPTGGIRGVAWDGRDESGGTVAAGTYRWELRVDAADGSGAATDVTGTATPRGTITVG